MSATEPISSIQTGHRGRWRRLDEPHGRYRLYMLIAVVLFIAAYAALGAKAMHNGEPASFLVNDAPGYYAYLPSVLLDHDLDFHNQIENQFHGQANTVGPSYLKPRWPIGVALTLLPAYLAAQGASWGLYAATGSAHFTPNGYSLLYEPVCFAWVLLLSWGTMVLADRILRQRFAVSGRVIAAAVVSYWLGTHYLWYCFREPFMAHVISAFWVAAVVYIIHRMMPRIKEGRLGGGGLLLLAWCVSMALVCRLTNAVLLPLFLYLLYVIIQSRQLRRFAAWLPVALLGLFPLVLQAAAWGKMQGDAVPDTLQMVGYEKQEGFGHLADPRLWQTLFSSRHGLIFWSPLLALSALGILLYLIKPLRGIQGAAEEERTRRDPILIALLCSAGLLWYLNSAWSAWWFGSAFGGRAFLGMSILFIIGLGLCYEYARRAGKAWAGATAAAAILCMCAVWLLMVLRMGGKISKSNYLFGAAHHASNARES